MTSISTDDVIFRVSKLTFKYNRLKMLSANYFLNQQPRDKYFATSLYIPITAANPYMGVSTRWELIEGTSNAVNKCPSMSLTPAM